MSGVEVIVAIILGVNIPILMGGLVAASKTVPKMVQHFRNKALERAIVKAAEDGKATAEGPYRLRPGNTWLAAKSAASEVLMALDHSPTPSELKLAVKAASAAARAELSFGAARRPTNLNAMATKARYYRSPRNQFSSMTTEELKAYLIGSGTNAANVRGTEDPFILQQMAREVFKSKKGGALPESEEDPIDFLLINEEILYTIFETAFTHTITSEEDAIKLIQTLPELQEIVDTLKDKFVTTNSSGGCRKGSRKGFRKGFRKGTRRNSRK
jgi:hypothetical protein